MGFKGWVMSDWGATHSMSINAGLDQEMPGQRHMSNDNIRKALQNGTVTQAKIDDSARRVLTPLFAVGAFDKNNTNVPENNVTNAAHNQLAMELSAMSTILLKNKGGILPLTPGDSYSIAIIGAEAMGITVHGGGSGHVNPAYVSPPRDAIAAKLGVPALSPPPPVPNNCSDGNYLQDHDYANTDHQTSVSAASVAACCELCAQSTTKGVTCKAFSFVHGRCFLKGSNSNLVSKKGVIAGTCHAKPNPHPKPQESCTHDNKKCLKYVDGSDIDAAADLAKASDVAIVFIATSSHEGSII